MPNLFGADYVLSFVFGAVIGSFLNVCIYRIPKKISVVFPRSHCTKCGHAIRWYDNIPILSYVLLAGRCGHCRAWIPLQYIVVEVLTALLMLGLYAWYGATARFFAYAVMTCGLLVATFIDLATYEIPDRISLGGVVAGLALSWAFPSLQGEPSRVASLLQSLAGVLAGGGAIYIMGFVGWFIFRKEAMGFGDVKLMAAIGAFLGWKLVLLAFFIAPFFGSILGIILKVREGKDIIPYGPFLSIAALVAVFFGEKIVHMLFFGLY